MLQLLSPLLRGLHWLSLSFFFLLCSRLLLPSLSPLQHVFIYIYICNAFPSSHIHLSLLCFFHFSELITQSLSGTDRMRTYNISITHHHSQATNPVSPFLKDHFSSMYPETITSTHRTKLSLLLFIHHQHKVTLFNRWRT